MVKWKTRNPDLKVIWSLGGWSYSRPFFDMTRTEQSRKVFIDSVLAWLDQPIMGFVDGADIDWEFPGGLGLDADKGDKSVDGRNFTNLVRELRAALDELGEKKARQFELTTAIGVGPNQLANWAVSSQISEMLPYLDRLGLMTYDFTGAWDNDVGFNAAAYRPASDKDHVNIETVLETLKADHGITDFSKISLGLGFYGRSHGNVSETNPANLPGAASSGGGKGGNIETGVFSYFDLYQNYIGANGEGINGWKAYYYPEYAGALLHNASKKQVISFTPYKGVDAIIQLGKKYNVKGVFAWTVDDDNGQLLEAIHQSYGHARTTVQASSKPYIYAPVCDKPKNLKPGRVYTMGDTVYNVAGWVSQCPGEGEAWAQNAWQPLGKVSDFNVLGLTQTNYQEASTETVSVKLEGGQAAHADPQGYAKGEGPADVIVPVVQAPVVVQAPAHPLLRLRLGQALGEAVEVHDKCGAVLGARRTSLLHLIAAPHCRVSALSIKKLAKIDFRL